MQPVVIKISGHELNDDGYLTAFALVVRQQTQPVIVVHGGGRDITMLQERLGIVPQFVEGLRVTDAASLEVVEMVLCGRVNKRLVRYLLTAGVDALGLSGVDRGMIRAQPIAQQMMYTGRVEQVYPAPLLALLAEGVVPVVAPICLGEGSTLNVNADDVAAALAQAVRADRLVYLTNVAGVLDRERRRIARLSPGEAQAWISDGTISGGMIPKVSTALACARMGVPAVITDLEGFRTHHGTVIDPETE